MHPSDEVVFYEKPFAIIKCERLFAAGFNVYKEVGGDGEIADMIKINNPCGWFTTYDAAMSFLLKQKSQNAPV